MAGETVWLFPPFSRGAEFLTHYLACKAKVPARTSAVIILPAWPTAPWASLVSSMQLVRTYPAGSTSPFTTCVGNSATPQDPVDPLPWAVNIYYDPPTPPAKLPSARVTNLAAAGGNLLVLAGTIKGHPVKVLVDSGATHNFLSATFVHNNQIPTSPIYQTKVYLADGSINPTRRRCEQLQVHLDTYSTCCDLLVTHLDSHDVVLGMHWLQDNNPAIDFATGTITINNHTLQGICHTQAPHVQILDARHMFKTLKDDSTLDVFFATLQAVDDKTSPNPLRPPTDQSPEWTAKLHRLLDQHQSLFDEPTEMPPARAHDHTIDLIPGSTPPQQRTYRMSPLELKEVERQLQDYLAKGWIQPSSSSFGAPILFARKKDGTLRMCVDYRALNAISIKNRYPLPRIDELLDQLQGSTIFTALDLWSGYHQVRINPKDTHKSAFRTRYGHFEFTVLPFGLTNAPATFMGLMNDVLRPYLDKFVVVYLDDILVYSKSAEEHLDHLNQVLTTLAAHKLKVKLKKCAFGQSSVPFLGLLVTDKGVLPDPDKVRAVQDWPPPTNVTEVRSFLGFTGFCRKFIRDYATLAAPLTRLTRSDVPFPAQLTPDQQAAFSALKHALTSAPLLVLPKLGAEHEFTLYTDASQMAVGAVLLQDQGLGLQPVAYESRKLNDHEKNYPIAELELLAVVHALRVFRCYLEGCRSFTVITDHDTLRYFLTQKTLAGRKARWQELISPFAPS